MRFEVGKYYRHSGGGAFHVLVAAQTEVHGDCLIVEEHSGRLCPVGTDESNAEHWEEITEAEWNCGDNIRTGHAVTAKNHGSEPQ